MTFRCEPVIGALATIDGFSVVDFDESIALKPIDRPIQRTDTNVDRCVRKFGDRLEDAVAMVGPLASTERVQKDVVEILTK